MLITSRQCLIGMMLFYVCVVNPFPQAAVAGSTPAELSKAVSARFVTATEAELEHRAKFAQGESSATFLIKLTTTEVTKLRETAVFRVGTVQTDGSFVETKDSKVTGWSISPPSALTVAVAITVRRPITETDEAAVQLTFRSTNVQVSSRVSVVTSPVFTGKAGKAIVTNDARAHVLAINNTKSDWGGLKPDGTVILQGFGFPEGFTSMEIPQISASGGSGQLVVVEKVRLEQTAKVKSAEITTDKPTHPTLTVLAREWPKSFSEIAPISVRRIDDPKSTATPKSAKDFQKTAVELGELKEFSVTREKTQLGNIHFAAGKLEGYERRTTVFAKKATVPDAQLIYVTEKDWGFVAPSDARSLPTTNVKAEELITIDQTHVTRKFEKKKATAVDFHLKELDASKLLARITELKKIILEPLNSEHLLGNDLNEAVQQKANLQKLQTAVKDLETSVKEVASRAKEINAEIASVIENDLRSVRSSHEQVILDNKLRNLRQQRDLLPQRTARFVSEYHKTIEAIGGPTTGAAGTVPPVVNKIPVIRLPDPSNIPVGKVVELPLLTSPTTD